ncbi:hypothetical protein HZA98_00490, partial [Candidatus Woesearchaeota archaeon]|nr:hypothetical protein [Candidatus Woesearchaeota archaeon]
MFMEGFMMKNILQKVSVLLVVFLMAMTSVAAADITLTYPVGGEYINNDGSTPITWTRIGSCGTGADPVHIEYTADASDPYTLLTTTASASSGLYNWNTLGLPDGNEYIVRISSIGTCSSTDSSGTFTLDSIAPTINSDTLLTPNGGEDIAGGSFFDITWDSGDITDTNLGSTPISLYYSTNSGASWTLITSAQANDGSYLWTVPVVNTTAAKVNITATDLAGHTVSDISN